jgi:hypothetical protein
MVVRHQFQAVADTFCIEMCEGTSGYVEAARTEKWIPLSGI